MKFRKLVTIGAAIVAVLAITRLLDVLIEAAKRVLRAVLTVIR